MVCLLPFTPTRAIQRSPHVARSFASHSTWPGLSFLGLSMSWETSGCHFASMAERKNHSYTNFNTKFPSSLIIRWVVSSEGHVLPQYLLQEDIRVNAAGCIGVLETVVMPWIDPGATGEAKRSSAGLRSSPQGRSYPGVAGSEPLHGHVLPDILPPSSPDLNPTDYYAWGVFEKETNKCPGDTKEPLKEVIVHVTGNMHEAPLICACSCFRSHMGVTVEAEGGSIE